MLRKWEERTNTFEARDTDGKVHSLVVYQAFLQLKRIAKVPGLKRIVAGDGRAVQRLQRGQYQIPGVPPIVLWSDDPAAE